MHPTAGEWDGERRAGDAERPGLAEWDCGEDAGGDALERGRELIYPADRRAAACQGCAEGSDRGGGAARRARVAEADHTVLYR